MKNLIFLISLSLSTFLNAQTNDLPNRDAFTLKLAVDDTNFYEAEIKSSPYILPDNTIQIYPGETLYVEIELKKNEIRSMKTVKENLNPEKTITIAFSQQTEEKVHKGMMLKVTNPFDKNLEYKARIFLMKSNKWTTTSILPIYPKISGYETWPDVIVTIALSGWTLK